MRSDFSLNNNCCVETYGWDHHGLPSLSSFFEEKYELTNASRPSEHPPVRGGKYVKTFRWDLGFFFFFSFFVSLINSIADGASTVPSCLWSLRIFPNLSPIHALRFFIAMQAQHCYNSSTNHNGSTLLMILTFSRFPLRKKEHKFW